MPSSIFVSNSKVALGSGGGIVSYNIALALKESTDLKLILCNGGSDLAKSVDINPTSYGLSDVPFLWDYLAYQFIRKSDILHIRGDPFGATVEKARRLGVKKVIVDVPAHNVELSVEEFRRLGLEYPFRHMVEERLWNIFIKHINEADVVVVPSTLSKEYIEKSGRFNIKGELIIIPHGCDIPDVITYVNDIVVGYLGAVGPDKGLIYLIEAIRKVKAKLLLAGRYMKHINVKDLELRKKVEKIGYVENPSDFYNRINIYVQPSVTEGFGIPALEAMAYGRPIIVTEGTGVKDLVVDGKNGFIVPIRDPNAIAEKIQYFIDNPTEIFRMGRNARETAKNYTWDSIRKAYMGLYEI